MTAADIRLVDLRHLGRPKVIGCWLIGDVLVDPGPASCGAELLRHLAEPPRAILVTHVHLDHAAGVGALVARWPEITVFVHERGARHLADPRRLLASAGRLYGGDMARLWGEMPPVPEENIQPLAGGETVLGAFHAADTPGHASHHLAYLHAESGWAFTGDVAGVRIPPSAHVLMPTPPPDIDVEAWHRSLRLLADWEPDAIVPTHFGAFGDVEEHLAGAEEGLALATGRARSLPPAEFLDAVRGDVEQAGAGPTAAAYAQAAPLDHHYLGLRRFLDREPAATPSVRKA